MRWKGDKGKAWQAVRNYVKAKETSCYTCQRQNLQGINAQAGHYKPVAIVGSNNHYSWREEFIHLQCSYCNGPGQGMAVEFRKRLVQDFGERLVKEFDTGYRKVRPIKDWGAIIKHYEQLLEGVSLS